MGSIWSLGWVWGLGPLPYLGYFGFGGFYRLPFFKDEGFGAWAVHHVPHITSLLTSHCREDGG